MEDNSRRFKKFRAKHSELTVALRYTIALIMRPNCGQERAEAVPRRKDCFFKYIIVALPAVKLQCFLSAIRLLALMAGFAVPVGA